jgi:hypothetical protein
MKKFIDSTLDDPMDVARFISLLDLTSVLAVLNAFHCSGGATGRLIRKKLYVVF